MEFLPVSWSEVHKLSLKLAEAIVRSKYVPDMIIGILRGGFIVARILADALDVDELGVVEVKFYKSVGERAERPIITQPLVVEVRDKNVLIVDDVVDSGRTLEIVSQQVRLRGAKKVKSAALFVKPRSIINPDYYVIKTTKWILFPWELGEFLRDSKISSLGRARSILSSIGFDVEEDILTLLVNVLRDLKHYEEIKVPGSRSE